MLDIEVWSSDGVKMKKWIFMCGILLAASSFAKLPALSAEAKAKAEEAKAKTAWSDKVAAFQLCKSQDKVAAQYWKTKGAAASGVAASIPACADPGPYVPAAPVAAPNATAASGPVVANANSIASKK